MAQDTIEGINPTRMELLNLKNREKLAVKGHSLLKEKRDALIMEFFEILDRVKGSREKTEEKLKEAYTNLTNAQVVMGDLSVQKAVLAVKESVDVKIESRSIMGVIVPVIDSQIDSKTVVTRGYGFSDTSVKLDEAAKKFEEAITLIIELGEIEKTIYLLAAEIESTKRRVNALEHIMVPKIKNTVKSIEMRLQEMERETFVQLKMIKSSIDANS